MLSLNFLILEKNFFFEWELLRIIRTKIFIIFLLDWIRLIFLSLVLFISRIVIYYRNFYMEFELNINRFIILVLIFVFSIIFIILSPNIIRILLGWDGLGLVSYCLVIYYQNLKSYNAGILTALTNRLGDVAILISIGWIINYGRWNFLLFFDFIIFDFEIKIIFILVILAAITKRAQIPFSSWLPAAIAAPTPVSALVHSSTLVTAGIYLMIRFRRVLLEIKFLKILFFFSRLTIFIAGIAANFEFDLKKIIALSTLRQLGLIIRILCLGFEKLAFFHLLTHALFKALLFLCAGRIIHRIKNSQDIRDIGCLYIQLPFSISCLNISNLSLSGLPFLSGFYSKDLILEITLISEINNFIFFLFFFSTFLTVIYSFRLIYYSLIKESSMNVYINFLDNNLFIIFRIFMLLLFAIFGGSILNWILFPFFFFISLKFIFKFLTLVVCFLGIIIGIIEFLNFLFSFNKSLKNYFFFFFLE